MIRLAVSVEGQTEEELIKGTLARYLQLYGIATVPILLGRARNRGIGGGNVTVPRLVTEMAHLSLSFDAVTTFVDFYGFDTKERHSAGELEQVIRSGVEERTGWLGDRAMPYVQLHEFESLLFSDVHAFPGFARHLATGHPCTPRNSISFRNTRRYKRQQINYSELAH